MTQEDKNLLLRDLCARLPYGVKIELTWLVMGEGTYINASLEPDHIEQLLNDEDGDTEIKPYLRPMSSMTEEEKHELLKFGVVSLDKDNNANDVCCVGFWNHAKVQDYLNSIHVDYRRLIEKDLAIEAPEGMYC